MDWPGNLSLPVDPVGVILEVEGVSDTSMRTRSATAKAALARKPEAEQV